MPNNNQLSLEIRLVFFPIYSIGKYNSRHMFLVMDGIIDEATVCGSRMQVRKMKSNYRRPLYCTKEVYKGVAF
jgi:hypothetical protein